MARKQYTGAKLTILALAGGAVMTGTAWLGANQPAADSQAAAETSAAPTSTPAAAATATARATAKASTQPATRAKTSRAS